MVGVEGLEAGLGRAVEGAGDTESVVQDLQLRDNKTEKPEEAGRAEGGAGDRRGETGRGQQGEKDKSEPRSKERKQKTKTKAHQCQSTQ